MEFATEGFSPDGNGGNMEGPTWFPSLAAKHHLGIVKLITSTQLSNICYTRLSCAYSSCFNSAYVAMAWMRVTCRFDVHRCEINGSTPSRAPANARST